MSGSPVLWNGYVVGILTAESVEAQNRGKQVIDVNAISNRRALSVYENLGIVIEKGNIDEVITMMIRGERL